MIVRFSDTEVNQPKFDLLGTGTTFARTHSDRLMMKRFNLQHSHGGSRLGKLVNKELRLLELRAACFQILARHTQDVVARSHLLELAEEQDEKIAAVKSRSEIWHDVQGHA